jgi:hypothetical protein
MPSAAVLMPVAFFTAVTDADATEPNAMILLAPVGGSLLATGTFILGIGLLRRGVSGSSSKSAAS